jgi:hypothetical protein
LVSSIEKIGNRPPWCHFGVFYLKLEESVIMEYPQCTMVNTLKVAPDDIEETFRNVAEIGVKSH